MAGNPTFRRLAGQFDRMLVCPVCLETLLRDDIEQFPACPFCESPIALDGEVEEFLLQPFIERWVVHQAFSHGFAAPGGDAF